ncbi:DUF6979 family protein [Paenibacillus odorifer]|uniref:DUF6979 family protein n=1 Tax=Paenibacillus odorifer TaxID=189426 RepID=UPI00096CB866|nr:hypothetical protein [Paenibacillus odorifer]OMD48470.1 hypothetical protein BSK55_29145 [Paenibacillus odorifer]
MNKYAQSAIRAVELCKLKVSPIDAWNTATLEHYKRDSDSQKKGCPRYAFLGLCEEGLIKGVRSGTYILKSKNKNKVYAVKAVELLKANPELAKDKKRLWNEVVKGDKKHNSQMNVVLALWGNGLFE